MLVALGVGSREDLHSTTNEDGAQTAPQLDAGISLAINEA
jgi:hypothetical protein